MRGRAFLLAALAAALAAPAVPARPSFPGENGLLAYSLALGDRSEIGVVDPQKRDARLLPRGRESRGHPAWSPDGKWILYVGSRGGEVDLYVMAADGTGVRRLTWTRGVHEADPAWSPSGRQIVFASARLGERYDIWVANADGTRRRRLTRGAADERYPAWSARGIAFAGNRSGRYETYVVGREGKGLRQLTDLGISGAKFGGTQPTWAPGGGAIAFSSDRNRAGYREIWVMRADGTGQRWLAGFGCPCSDSYPAWSPDGTMVAYASGISIEVVAAASGRHVRTLSSALGGKLGDPDWQPLPR